VVLDVGCFFWFFSDLWFGGGFWCVPVGGLGSPTVSVTAGTVGASSSDRR